MAWVKYQDPCNKPLAEKSRILRAIFVWPWNENARTKQKQKTNGNRVIWLVYRTDTNALGFSLVKLTLKWKNFMPENFLEINWFFTLTSYCNLILQHDWPIEQWLLHIRVHFGGKTKRPCFDLFTHWLIKQIRNTYRNHFSRSYENHSNRRTKETFTPGFYWKEPQPFPGHFR